MPHKGPICHIFSKVLTPELQRMTKGERAIFLLDLAWRWGCILRRFPPKKPPTKKK